MAFPKHPIVDVTPVDAARGAAAAAQAAAEPFTPPSFGKRVGKVDHVRRRSRQSRSQSRRCCRCRIAPAGRSPNRGRRRRHGGGRAHADIARARRAHHRRRRRHSRRRHQEDPQREIAQGRRRLFAALEPLAPISPNPSSPTACISLYAMRGLFAFFVRELPSMLSVCIPFYGIASFSCRAIPANQARRTLVQRHRNVKAISPCATRGPFAFFVRKSHARQHDGIATQRLRNAKATLGLSPLQPAFAGVLFLSRRGKTPR